VSERTGYPPEMLELDLDLEADLGIDSIKRVEILGSLQQNVPMGSNIDLEALAGRKTLKAILEFLQTHATGPASTRPGPSTAGVPGAEGSPSWTPTPAKGPLIGDVISLVPGESLVAMTELDLGEHAFLLDHAFGRPVSDFDPGVMGVPVLPLTVSMEIVAEAAALLAPGHQFLGLRNVRGHRWITVEGRGLGLKITAQSRPATTGREFLVRVHEVTPTGTGASEGMTPAVEAIALFGDHRPEPPPPDHLRLTDEEPSFWPPDRLYEDVMFHGPSLRGIVSMDAIGPEGARATLRVLSPEDLLRSDPRPTFLTDPVLLDQGGQVLGLWGMQRIGTGLSFLPFCIEELRLYGESPQPGGRIDCHVRITRAESGTLRGDFDLVGSRGQVWAHVRGWEDRRFFLPEPVRHHVLSPRRSRLGRPLAVDEKLLRGIPDALAYRLDLKLFPAGFFSEPTTIWERALAHSNLSRAELERWKGLHVPSPQRTDWLLSRIVAKDAVHEFVRRRSGVALSPCDIVIEWDGGSRPVVLGPGVDRLGGTPSLALTRSAGVNVAVVGPSGCRLGIDAEALNHRPTDTEAALTAGERARLAALAPEGPDEWRCRAVCAKNAAAKALGVAATGGPPSFSVEAVDPETGEVRLAFVGPSAHRDVVPPQLSVMTARDGLLVIAVSYLGSETE
jgi:hypothetical protein